MRKRSLDREPIPLLPKRFIDGVFSLWNITKGGVDGFIEQANKFHPTSKFTVKISEKEITFLDTNVYKGQRFYKESLLDVQAYGDFSVHEFSFVPPTRC